MLIKVVTINIWRGKFFENIIEFVKKEDPDLIFFQEVYDGHGDNLSVGYRFFSEFKSRFPEYNGFLGAGFKDITNNENADAGSAIFSKHRIVSSTNTFLFGSYRVFRQRAQTDFSKDPVPFVYANIDPLGTEINAFCAHGIWGFDGKDSTPRLKMVDDMIKLFEGKKNVILAGDFNMGPDTESIHKIEKHLTSVFGTSLKTTFNMKHKDKPGFAISAVDMMFVSPNIKIIDKKCPDVDVSDHLPLLATLEL